MPTRRTTLAALLAAAAGPVASADAVEQLIAFGAATQMDSLLVMRHGRIVLEHYYAPFQKDQRHRINSATKGVTAALIGAAIHAGLLAGTDVALFDPRKSAIRVQHLLDMTSGIDWDESLNGKPVSAIEMEHARDWVGYVLDRPMKHAPGEVFNYNSGNSQLLSAIITRATGMRAEKFAVEKLFGPMGITDFDWNVDSQGLSTGGFGLRMTTRDMAKLGQLYLQQGVWDGNRLLPAGWTERPRQARVPMNLGTPDEFFYADGWWVVPRRGLQMLCGFNRQLVIVQPSTGLVAVTTGRGPWRFERFFDLLAAPALPRRGAA